MKILRWIVAVILLLVSLVLFAVTAMIFFVFDKPFMLQIADRSINLGYIYAGGGVVLLLLTVITLPLGGKKGTGGKNMSAAAARKELKSQLEMQRRIADPADHNFEVPEDAGVNLDENVATYARLEDPQAMARLVAIEQAELTRPVVTSLLQEYYPALVHLIDRVAENDHTSLDTIGKHIISIARNRLKLTDKELTDNQFSIFQENVFKEEQHPFLQIYKPADGGQLEPEQKTFVGMVVDKRAWEKAQRRVRGEHTDWQQLSLINAAGLLG